MNKINKWIDWSRTSRWLKLQKEGILVGTFLAVYIYWKNINIFIPIDEYGLPRLAILIFLFSTAGALIDSIIRPRK